jgi:hypothetical protein
MPTVLQNAAISDLQAIDLRFHVHGRVDSGPRPLYVLELETVSGDSGMPMVAGK